MQEIERVTVYRAFLPMDEPPGDKPSGIPEVGKTGRRGEETTIFTCAR